ncbi:hypothetical protein [Nocardioides sp. TF02-7]|uniref:hypothetical protein n=1 Tax=Nocardioides sp. TF02-7 TaxID=2917724 RepID=UPI001F065E24|nr:hypothetical protein [Nocardioides sp. TF02-7]UMG94997.1 hypothetical protein MF408_02690 [Nocardioides sp. TF02-7]
MLSKRNGAGEASSSVSVEPSAVASAPHRQEDAEERALVLRVADVGEVGRRGLRREFRAVRAGDAVLDLHRRRGAVELPRRRELGDDPALPVDADQAVVGELRQLEVGTAHR